MVLRDDLALFELEDGLAADTAGQGAKQFLVHLCQVLSALDHQFLLWFAVGADNSSCPAGEQWDDADDEPVLHQASVFLVERDFCEAEGSEFEFDWDDCAFD